MNWSDLVRFGMIQTIGDNKKKVKTVIEMLTVAVERGSLSCLKGQLFIK